MRPFLPRAAVALAAAAALVAPTAAQAAPSPAAGVGSFAGSITGKRPAGSQATVFATNLSDGSVASATAVGRGGTFKVALPPGAYAVTTTVIPPVGGGTLSRASLPISLKRGQKRTRIAVRPKAVKRGKAKRSAAGGAPTAAGLATRAYTQESGATTPGVTAFSVEDFTGAAGGDWGFMNQGLTDLLITDLVGATPCKTAVIANTRDRQLVLDELKLQSSKYFDPKSRAKRNFIVGDLTVGGTISVASDGRSASVTVTITDARTGAVVDSLQTTLGSETFFEGEEALAKQIAERVCRRPAAYELTLNATGTATFGTHDAAGTATATLTANRSGGAPGEPASAWSGVGTGAWTGVTATAKVDCAYQPNGDAPFTFTAQLAIVDDQTVKVSWTTAGAIGIITATCPVKDRPPVVIPGQPGPSLIGVTPPDAVLPIGGGTFPISDGLSAPEGGWSNAGTITVKPVWTRS